MSDPIDTKNALDQMAYEVVDNGALDLPTAVPALFAFTDTAELTPGALEDALDEYGFSTLDTFSTTSDSGFYYKTRVMTDHYKDCVVKVWEDDVRIYPRDKELDTYELSRIIHAVEDAFNAEMENVEREDDDE